MPDVKSIIRELSLEQKCALLSRRGYLPEPGPAPVRHPVHLAVRRPPRRAQAGGRQRPPGHQPQRAGHLFPHGVGGGLQLGTPALGEEMGQGPGARRRPPRTWRCCWAPALNVKRSPLCGRNFEYFSEDPYLAGKMAASYIRGIQKKRHRGLPQALCRQQPGAAPDGQRFIVDERTLRNSTLTNFEIAVTEGSSKTIMTSYNLINGTYANENAHLLQEILRDTWGFDGAVVTDWGRFQRPCPGREERLHAGDARPGPGFRPGAVQGREGRPHLRGGHQRPAGGAAQPHQRHHRRPGKGAQDHRLGRPTTPWPARPRRRASSC